MNEIIAAAFGLMGAIVGSIITLAGQWRYEKTNKNRELSYAAIVISYAAKKLASSTWDAINNFDEYQQVYNKEHRHFPCDTPMLDLNSFDINWKAVPISCLDKIFECSNRLEIKQQYLNTPMASNMDVVECDAYMLLEQIEIIDTLLSAALRLRKEARIPEDKDLEDEHETAAKYRCPLKRYTR